MSALSEALPVQRVLLFDVNHRRREIRAANLRTRGVDVVCAKSLAEVRDFWHVDTFRLVLLETAECPEAVAFGDEIHSDDPKQRVAFFVGRPIYLSRIPAAVDDSSFRAIGFNSGKAFEEAFQALPQKNGFVEASLRMQLVRSSLRGATTVRPAKDPWAAMRAVPDAD
jgi:hypothetical protein